MSEGSVGKAKFAEKKRIEFHPFGTIIKNVERKPITFEYAEYVTVDIKTEQQKDVDKKTEEDTGSKLFDLPLINSVYNSWIQKKPDRKRKKQPKVSKKISKAFKKKSVSNLEIDEYEIIEKENDIDKPIEIVAEKEFFVTQLENEYWTAKEEPVETVERSVEKIFDIPILNTVHNDWAEKKHREQNFL